MSGSNRTDVGVASRTGVGGTEEEHPSEDAGTLEEYLGKVRRGVDGNKKSRER